MASMASRRRGGQADYTWPGYVDALASLLMVLVFLLAFYTVAQFALGTAVSERDTEIGRLKTDVTKRDSAIDKLSKDVSERDLAIERLNRQLAQLGDLLNMERGRVGELDRQVTTLTGQLRDETTARDKLAGDLAMAARRIEGFTAEQGRLNQRILDLGTARDKLSGELAEAQRRIEGLNSEQDRLTRRIGELDTTRDKLSGELAEAQRRIAGLGTEQDRLTRRLGEVDTARDKLAGELAEAQRRIQGYKTEQDRLNRRIAELTEEQGKLGRQAAGLTADRDKLGRQAAEVAAERDRLARQVAELTAERDRLARQAAGLAGDKARLERQVGELMTAEDKLARELTAAMSDREKLTAELLALTGNRDKLAALLKAAEASAMSTSADAQKAAEALRREIDRQKLELTRLAASLAAANNEKGKLWDQLTDEQKLTAESKAALVRLTAEMTATRAELARLNAALEAADVKAKEQQTQIVDLGQRLNRALATKVEELARYRSEFFGRMREALRGQTGIAVVGDRFVFQSEVLFDKGSAVLKPEGVVRMTDLALRLKEISAALPPDVNWVLQVEGHTDNVPINTEKFPSNWELSTARAIEVVKFFEREGFPAQRLVAAGHGANAPVDTGTGEAARARNRRIEIRLTNR